MMKMVKAKKRPGMATNQDGDNEAMLVSKIIAFMSMNGWTVWRQDNKGRFDSIAAMNGLILYVNNLIRCREGDVRRSINSGYDGEIALESARWKKDISLIIGRSYKVVPNSKLGVADVIGWNNTTGQFVGIEIKINYDKMSEHQIKWANGLKDANGAFFIAKTYEQFVESYNRRYSKELDLK
jgi:hypothetical protein